jgi:hypothetical protein
VEEVTVREGPAEGTDEAEGEFEVEGVNEGDNELDGTADVEGTAEGENEGVDEATNKGEDEGAGDFDFCFFFFLYLFFFLCLRFFKPRSWSSRAANFSAEAAATARANTIRRILFIMLLERK